MGTTILETKYTHAWLYPVTQKLHFQVDTQQKCTCMFTKRHTRWNVHRSSIHYSNKLESTQKLMKRGRDEHSRISYSNGNGQMKTIHSSNIKGEPGHQRCKLYDSIYVTFENWQS